MESRDSMGMPPPGPPGMMPGSVPFGGAFAGMLQREVGPPSGGSPSTGIPASPAPPPGLHAPAAMRPSSVPVIPVMSNTANPGPSPYPLDMATAVFPHPMPVSMSMGMGMGIGLARAEPVKRKRGRPRKYGPDGSMALALAPLSSAITPLSPSQKRGRGRPPGSGKKQQLAALGGWLAASAGFGFTPHVITIAAGEDVASKIMSFSQQGPRAICILSANGAISNVTLRQPAISGGTVTYEGRFEILSLSGSFLLTETGGTRSRTGGLSVSLAGPDGRVIGGGVAGFLVAASPVQVVVGSFLSNDRKSQKRPPNAETSTGLSQGFTPTGLSQGFASVTQPARPLVNEPLGAKHTVSNSPPPNQSTGAVTSGNHQQQGQSMAAPIQSVGWPSSQPSPEARRNTDINISLPGG